MCRLWEKHQRNEPAEINTYLLLGRESVHAEERNEPHFSASQSAAKYPASVHYQLQDVLKR